MKNCELCKVEFEAKRADAKYCSPKCRKDASRTVSLEGVQVAAEEVFQFRTPSKEGFNEDKPRTAKYWYDVPIATIPVVGKGNPPMPEFMDGRQYFLWWKNNFKIAGDETPIILNPHRVHDKLEYKLGGQGSRHWGAA